MGHASITITLDRYGHLLPGNEHEAAELLDQWLTTSRDQIRLGSEANGRQSPRRPAVIERFRDWPASAAKAAGMS